MMDHVKELLERDCDKIHDKEYREQFLQDILELFRKEPDIGNELLRKWGINKNSWDIIHRQPGCSAIIDLTNGYRIVEANDRFYKELGYAKGDDVTKLRMRDVIFNKDYGKFLDYSSEISYGELNEESIEVRVEIKNQGLHWVELIMNGFNAENNGENEYAVIAIRSVEKQKILEDNLRIQMERYNMVKDLSNEFIFEYSVINDIFILPDDILLRRGLYPSNGEGIPSEDFEAMVHPEDWKNFEREIRKMKGINNHGIVEFRLNLAKIGKSPSYNWYRTFYKKVEGSSGNIIRVIGRTINIQYDRQRVNEMELKVRQDPMTGMLNKTATEYELSNFFAGSPEGQHALIMIDVDNFKRVNDCFGHMYGDTVLRDVASKILGRFRSSDIVGRVGGDEFLICMKDATIELAIAVAEEICEITRHEIRTDSDVLEVSCSVGIAVYPDSGLDFAELFKKTEVAMYTAKNGGKGKVCVFDRWGYESQMASVVKERSTLSEYRMSVQSDTDFLTMCFEMLVDANNLDAAMNLLIEHIGKRYGLGAVAVFKFEQNSMTIVRTNKWTKEQGILTMPGRSFFGFDNRRFIESFDSSNCIVIDDMTVTDKISERERELLLEDNILACLYAKFHHSDSVEGCVAYQSINSTRKWSDAEKNFFSEFARVIGVFSALRDRQIRESNDLAELKNRDRLTGMLTEEAFVQQINQFRKEHPKEEKLIVVNLDIDGFSYVNENFGIAAGNELLEEFALVFKREEEGIFACRQFSDFFAGFFAGYTMKQVQALLRRAEVEFSSRVRKYYPNSGIRVSIGLYEWDEDVSINYAIENANMARKSAKKSGSGKMQVYNSEMRNRRVRDRIVASEFKAALASDQFSVYIQPKFELKTKKVVGAECLSRWIDSDGNVVPPAQYVDSLERIGYITELDFYILEKALVQMKKWKESGFPMIPMSVNFSRKHFEINGVYKKIKRLVDMYKIPHSLIEIELTESLLSERTEKVIQEMQLLREDGFRVDIDDFGTGYSSLSMLLEIPTDVVKFDKSFLQMLEGQAKEESKQFMSLLAQMIYIRNNEIVCEGVETEEQVKFLIDCGFKVGQGYLCDMPIPLDEFAQKYVEKNAKYSAKT